MNWKRQCFIIQQHKLYKHPHTAFQENSTISWSAAESHKQDRADWLVQIMFFGCKDTCINVHLWINYICFHYHSQGILDKHMLMKRFITTTTRWCSCPLLIVPDRMLSSVSGAQFAALWFAECIGPSMQSARLSCKRTAANLRVWQIVQQRKTLFLQGC